MPEARILLAEDQHLMRDTQRRLLNAMGYPHVTGVRNGEEAWETLSTGAFDLVLCDWNMPKLNGLGLLQRMRNNAQTGAIPFIMITGENTGEQVRSALAFGATDFIVKPFTAALLEQRIERALNSVSAPKP